MHSVAYVHVRLDPDLKKRSEEAFRRMGLIPASGVRLLLSMLVNGQLPLPAGEEVVKKKGPVMISDPDDPCGNTYTPEQIEFERRAACWKRGYYESPSEKS